MRFLISLCVLLLLLINVAFTSISVDPCSNYESLDRPWRATNESGLWICDDSFSWNGWYRFFYNGMDIRMPESCVSGGSCNTDISLALNGSHPQMEDGVVVREICGASYWNGCCDDRFSPIRVKACPGDYYVYELVKPQYECSAYCMDISTISQTASTASPALITESSLTTSAINTDFDPCYNYDILDNYWRNTLNYWYMYGYISGYDDARAEWHGWYRLFINGSSAQMPEWCFSSMSCGGYSSLWLDGSHPQLEDGVVSRDVYGSINGQCSSYRSDPIQVKACPANYYVYKLIRPKPSIPVPVYCAVAFNTPSSDPCYNYTSLDEPWRATDNSYGSNMCDYNVDWNGWYRLFYNGQGVQMPESCVNSGMCGTSNPLWLNGPHPQLEDGVVTRQICSSTWSDCCGYRSHPIQVKACPGNYYVYEFVRPLLCASYCADVTSLNVPHASTTIEASSEQSSTEPVSYQVLSIDPCYSYTVLDNPWRATDNRYTFNLMCDVNVNWAGWYRLFIQGQSVQMPDTCVDRLSCGTHAPLWLNGPHPRVEDGVVRRDVCGHWMSNCCFFQSNPINVKACPGNYYVYEFVRPTFCYGTYCAEVRNISIINPSVTPETTLAEAFRTDPCYSYTALDDYWRATDYHYSYNCDAYVNFVGWYRLFVRGENAQMPETCVAQISCGTVAPLWLNGQHPRVEDGVVTRHVCGHWNNDCCNYEFHPMKVKACPGGYYVYQFINPVFCNVAYCADVVRNNNTTVMPQTSPTDYCSGLNCTEDERCEKIHGVYGCVCRDNHYSSQNDSFDFIETCESSSGFMSLSRCQLFEAGFPSDILHLNDPNCTGIVRNGRVEFYFDNNHHICGTSLVANGTHFIYENLIVGEPDTVGHVISRKKTLKLPFRCVYSQTQSLSMDINPLESIVHKILPAGQGTYQVRMIPYRDAEFLQPFTGNVSMELYKRIFVEVRVDGVDSHQFDAVIDRCWATPVNDPHYSLRWDLIVDKCPNPDDNTVDLLQNGVSTSSRFSFEMFIFTANSTKVYLHCTVHLCLQTENNCSVLCDSEQHHREGRSVDFQDSASISVGPFVWSDSNKDMQVPRQVQASRAPWLCGSLILSLFSLMCVLIFF